MEFVIHYLKTRPYKVNLLRTLLFISCCYTTPILSSSDTIISVGTRLMAPKWVETLDGEETYSSESSRQIAFNLGVQKGKFYAGYSVNVSQFETTEVDISDINRIETDLIVGYYFFDNISLFLDYKTIESRVIWHNTDPVPDFELTPEYQQHQLFVTPFQGIGFGISGNWPLNDNLSLFSSYGIVPDGNKLVNYPDFSQTSSTAFELGSAYRVNNNMSINFGYRIHTQKFKYRQSEVNFYSGFKDEISGIFIGYNYFFN